MEPRPPPMMGRPLPPSPQPAPMGGRPLAWVLAQPTDGAAHGRLPVAHAQPSPHAGGPPAFVGCRGPVAANMPPAPRCDNRGCGASSRPVAAPRPAGSTILSNLGGAHAAPFIVPPEETFLSRDLNSLMNRGMHRVGSFHGAEESRRAILRRSATLADLGVEPIVDPLCLTPPLTSSLLTGECVSPFELDAKRPKGAKEWEAKEWGARDAAEPAEEAVDAADAAFVDQLLA